MHPHSQPPLSVPRDARHKIVVDLVRAGGLRSQHEIQDRLAERGIVVNQATLSRDITALGLRKGPDGYELPTAAAAAASGDADVLARAVATWLAEVSTAQNLVVLKTPPGGAQPLAIALDRARWRAVAGTLAGDDTVFVATRSASDAKHVHDELIALRGAGRRS